MGREGGGKKAGDRGKGVREDAGGEAFESVRSRPPESFGGLPRASRGGRKFWKGRARKVFDAILDPHKTRNTPSCGMEKTTVIQNSEGGGFRSHPNKLYQNRNQGNTLEGGGSRRVAGA